MIQENKKKLILTSIVTLAPILLGLLLWDKLPEQVPTHWNAAGEVDGWSSKAFSVFGLPVILFALHWMCLLATNADPKKQNIQGKLLNIVLWICPIVSWMAAVLSYGTALGIEFKMDKLMPIIMGVMFIVVGNYLPKCKQSYTMGIKLPWTLNDEENWNRTHRMAGKLWVVGGIVILALVFAPTNVLLITALVFISVLVIVPTVYSYLLYSKAKSNS